MNWFDILNPFALVLYGVGMFLFGRSKSKWSMLACLLIIVLVLFLFTTYDWS